MHEEVFIPPFLSLIAIPTPITRKSAAFGDERVAQLTIPERYSSLFDIRPFVD